MSLISLNSSTLGRFRVVVSKNRPISLYTQQKFLICCAKRRVNMFFKDSEKLRKKFTGAHTADSSKGSLLPVYPNLIYPNLTTNFCHCTTILTYLRAGSLAEARRRAFAFALDKSTLFALS